MQQQSTSAYCSICTSHNSNNDDKTSSFYVLQQKQIIVAHIRSITLTLKYYNDIPSTCVQGRIVLLCKM